MLICELCHGSGESPVYTGKPCPLCSGDGIARTLHPLASTDVTIGTAVAQSRVPVHESLASAASLPSSAGMMK